MRLILILALLSPASGQVLTASKILSGNGTDAAAAIATDSEGNVSTLYLNGFGQTIPGGVDGALNSGVVQARSVPSIWAGGQLIQPPYLGGAPGESTGVFQMNIAAPPPASGPSYVQIFGRSDAYFLTVQVYTR